MKDNFRGLVAGLAGIPPLTVGGREYTGPYLAQLMVVNPDLPADESARTPQLIVELGCLLATARYELDKAEVNERVWRYELIASLTTDPDAVETAQNMGYLGDDATKPLTKTAAQALVHNQPEYVEHSEAQAQARYAVQVLEHAVAGAKARSRVVYDYTRQGGSVRPSAERQAVEPAPVDQSSVTVYDVPPDDFETTYVSQPRTPIPVAAAPSGPPTRTPPSRSN